ncbi:hypothetical protein D3C78_18520 [compost metagenome]
MVIVWIVLALVAIIIIYKAMITAQAFSQHTAYGEINAWDAKAHLLLFQKAKSVLTQIEYKHHWSVFVIRSTGVSLIIATIVGMFFGSFITFILVFISVTAIAWHPKVEQFNKVLKGYDEDFIHLLEAFVTHFRDYGNIGHTLTDMVNEIDSSLRVPAQLLANTLEAGETIDTALEVFYASTQNRWARAFGSLIQASYYGGGDISQASRDLMKRIRNSMGHLDKKKSSSSYTVSSLYVGMLSQPVVLVLAGFISPDFYKMMFTTSFGVSMINTMIIIDLATYLSIRLIQRRNTYDVT